MMNKSKFFVIALLLLFSYFVLIVNATKYITANEWRELYGPYDGYCIREWERIYQSTPFPTPGDIKYEECLWASDFWGPDMIAKSGGPHWACRSMKQDGERCGPDTDKFGNPVHDTCLGRDCSPPTKKDTKYYDETIGQFAYYHPDCIRDWRYEGGESPYIYSLQPTKDSPNPGTKRYDYCSWWLNEPYRDEYGTLWTPNWYCWDAKPDGSPCSWFTANKCYKGGCCNCFPDETRCDGTKFQTCNIDCQTWRNSGTDADSDGVDAQCGDNCDSAPRISNPSPEICTDGLDNDCDSWTDAADSNCPIKLRLTPDPAKPSQTVTAKVTGSAISGRVEIRERKSLWFVSLGETTKCSFSAPSNSCTFTAPSSDGTYSYRAYIGQNKDEDKLTVAQSTIDCPAGSELVDGICRKQEQPCPTGQTRNPNTGICEETPICNPGDTRPCQINGIDGIQTCISD